VKYFAILSCLTAVGSVSLLTAQDFGPLANSCAKMKCVVAKFTENTPQFTAVLSFQVFDAEKVPKLQMLMDLMVTEKDMREDIVVMAMAQIPLEHRTAMKSLQLDRMILITCPDKKKMYLTFPRIEAFQEFPISDDTLNEMTTRSKAVSFQKTEVGQETVNGYACTKTIVVVTESNRPPEKAIIWFASDLKEFPVRIAMANNKLLQVIEFKNVQLEIPKPIFFEVPTNYSRLEDTASVFRVAKERLEATGGSLATPPHDAKSSE